MDSRISMITLGVSDLDKSIEFYEKGLGFPRMESEPGIAFFTLRGTWLGLYPREALAEDATISAEGSGFSGITFSHNVESEAEVHQVFQQALDAGATLVKEPQKVFWGGYSGYFKDRDNYLWEVAYNPFTWIGPEKENA
jgi:catechol 2,3-dioxygenase-like lactoylglutathione lyase family enzyme